MSPMSARRKEEKKAANRGRKFVEERNMGKEGRWSEIPRGTQHKGRKAQGTGSRERNAR